MRKAVPADLVKAARIKAQLDRWVLDPDEIEVNSGGTDSDPAAASHPTGKGDFEAAGRPRGPRSVSSVYTYDSHHSHDDSHNDRRDDR